jgi:tRNA(Ile)-lysidine synthase
MPRPEKKLGYVLGVYLVMMLKLTQALRQRIESIPLSSHLWVAYSGGVDSHVLLYVLAHELRELTQGRLSAIHINHNLQSLSTAWAEHCQLICQQLKVPLHINSIQVSANSTQGLEAAAREARYAALHSCLKQNDILLTAHHISDQAETVLLQLLRGSGVRGLAAMSDYKSFGVGFLWRPFLSNELACSRGDLLQYAQANKLQWIEDSSNQNTLLTRNYIRHEIMPLLLQRWSASEKLLARTAQHCREAETLLEEIAANDITNIIGSKPNTLSISRLLKLSLARRHNALRFWLRERGLPALESKHFQQFETTIVYSQKDKQPLLRWGTAQIRRYRDDIFIEQAAKANDYKALSFTWDLSKPLTLPEGLGTLYSEQVVGKGFKITTNANITVRFRQGGERCQPLGRTGSHPLKKLLQEWGVPPWHRDKIPLLYQDDQLVSVVGYCICSRFAVKEDELGYVVNLKLSANIDKLM